MDTRWLTNDAFPCGALKRGGVSWARTRNIKLTQRKMAP